MNMDVKQLFKLSEKSILTGRDLENNDVMIIYIKPMLSAVSSYVTCFWNSGKKHLNLKIAWLN